MKKFLLSIILCLFCINIQSAEHLKVGDTKTLSIDNISHLQGCVWTISRPSNVTFTHTPGTYDTSVIIKAIKGFSGDPCIVQCKYYYLEKDPVSGRYIYSRSGYKDWHVFVEENGNQGEDKPNNPGGSTDKEIKLYTSNVNVPINEVCLLEGSIIDINVGSSYGKTIKWRIDDESIAKGTSKNDGWRLEVEGVSAGTTWAYATDGGGGQATCKIIVEKRTFNDGDYIRYPADLYDNLLFKVTDAKNKECKLSEVGNHYKDIDGVITIPAEVYGLTVVKVASDAVKNRKKVKKYVLPNTIRELEKSAFHKSEAEEVVLPIGLKTIGDYVFADSKLKSIVIPHGVQSIGYQCFRKSEVEEVELPIGLKTIGESAFAGSKLKSIVIPEGVQSLGKCCFELCMDLNDVILPSTLEKVSTGCFARCYNLKHVTLLEGIKYIDELAFDQTSVADLYIPASIQRIDNFGITSRRLVSMTCGAETPCELEGGIPAYDYLTLYVPKNSIDLYKKASRWNEFKSIKAIGEKMDESLYILSETRFGGDGVKAKIPYTKIDNEFVYSKDIKFGKEIPYYRDNNNFVIAEFIDNDFVKYGIESTNPIFTLEDISASECTHTFTLQKYDPEKNYKFTFPEGWPGATLNVAVDKEKRTVSFTYNSNVSGIRGQTLQTDEYVEIYKPNGVVVYRGKESECDKLESGIYLMKKTNKVVKLIE